MTCSVSPEAMRAAARAKIFQPGEMQVGFDTYRIHLLDVSRTGALVHAETPPELNSVVRLTVTAPLGRARVMWVTGKKFGVMFTTWLSDAQLAAVIAGHDAVRARLADQPVIPDRD